MRDERLHMFASAPLTLQIPDAAQLGTSLPLSPSMSTGAPGKPISSDARLLRKGKNNLSRQCNGTFACASVGMAITSRDRNMSAGICSGHRIGGWVDDSGPRAVRGSVSKQRIAAPTSHGHASSRSDEFFSAHCQIRGSDPPRRGQSGRPRDPPWRALVAMRSRRGGRCPRTE